MKSDKSLNMMKISIITVCRNEENSIEKTIQSVVGQTYTNIEYIIVDGMSSDNTMSIIKAYQDKYRISVVSEKDAGIYDAMNKGLSMATGDYIYFINAGDYLVSTNIIKKVVSMISKNKADIYYGKVYKEARGRYVLDDEENGGIIPLLSGAMPCHQGVFASRDAFYNNMFDIRYRIRADYNWILKCKKRGEKFCKIDIPVCRFNASGFSGRIKQKAKFEEETKCALKENYPFLSILTPILHRVMWEWRECKK